MYPYVPEFLRPPTTRLIETVNALARFQAERGGIMAAFGALIIENYFALYIAYSK